MNLIRTAATSRAEPAHSNCRQPQFALHTGQNDLDVDVRILRLELARDRQRRIGQRADAKNDLQPSRKFLRAEGEQGFAQARFVATERF